MSRKTVLIYATCQGVMIRDCLLQSPEFHDRYVIIDQIHNYDLIRNRRSFLTYGGHLENLKVADLFIYQPLRDEFGDNATARLMGYCKPGAGTISIPYVWNSSFWPLIKSTPADISDRALARPYRETFANSAVLKKLLNQGMTMADILAAYDAGKIDFDYTARFARNMRILSFKERHTDVKVVEYIMQNYKRLKLFSEPSHPSYHIMLHMANQILVALGLPPVQFDGGNTERFYLSELGSRPYDASAKQALGFKFDADADAHSYYRKLIEEYLTGVLRE